MLKTLMIISLGLLVGCQQMTPSQTSVRSAPLNNPQTYSSPPKFQWPASGVVTNGFNSSTQGINISGRIGAPVSAAAAGKVAYAGNGAAGFGNLIIIDHGNGFLTTYAHNNRLLVTPGDYVSAGQQVGEVGQTETDAPKLNFRMKQLGAYVDPLLFLPSKKKIAQSAAAADDDTCSNYGFKKGTPAFAECKIRIDLARREMLQQQEFYEQQMMQYQQQVAAQEAEKNSRQSAYMTELGLRMMGGQAPLDAAVSVGTGAPITQPQMPSTTRLYTLPNGRSMTCTSSGNVVNCF